MGYIKEHNSGAINNLLPDEKFTELDSIFPYLLPYLLINIGVLGFKRIIFLIRRSLAFFFFSSFFRTISFQSYRSYV